MSGDVEAREPAFVSVAAIGAVRARRCAAGACSAAAPTRGGRARTSPCARGRNEHERADLSWLRDAHATGRGGRKRSRTAGVVRDALETIWGRALSLTARRIEERMYTVVAEEDTDVTHLESFSRDVAPIVMRLVFSAFRVSGEPTTLLRGFRRAWVALRAAPPKHARVAPTRPARPARSDTRPHPRGPRRGEPAELGLTSAFVEIVTVDASFETRAERFRDSSS